MQTHLRRRGGVTHALAARAFSRATMLARVASRRGVTMVEYVILTAIVVFLGWLLREQLGAMFGSIMDDLRAALDGNR